MDDPIKTDPQDNAQPTGVADSLPARLLGRLASLRGKLIIPYVVLTILFAMIGIFVVTRLVSSGLGERLTNQINAASGVAADSIVRQEQDNLENLRLFVYADGAAEALRDQDRAALQQSLEHLVINSKVDIFTAVNLQGVEIYTIAHIPNSEEYILSEQTDFSSVPLVQKILERYADNLGDKFSGVMQTNFGPALMTSAPVYDAQGSLLGVFMVGSPLQSMLATAKEQTLADLMLMDGDHALVSTTLAQPEEIAPTLEDALGKASLGDVTTPLDIKLYNRDYKVLFSPFTIRQQDVGTLGVVMPSSYVASGEVTSRNTFSLIFTIGTAAIILVGYLLAQNIALPILRLRSLSQAVASGDLNQSIGISRTDEIGELARAFDIMTTHLRERTAEAERLYAESIQRNKELAEINARLQETQLQLIQSEKLSSIGQLTAGIVHDVKNPLTVIKGTAELLQEDGDYSEEMSKALSLIRESAVKANTIVSDLLKFARQAQPDLKLQDMRDTLNAALRLTTYLTRQARVKVETSLPDQPVMVVYDAQQIEQVFINMIANATQAMFERGILKMSLSQDDSQAKIIFQDTGTGIPPEILHRIFDPFFTTKPEGQGTGLGLSVSYGIITSHGGHIEVDSQVGIGTCFTIHLPNAQKVADGEGGDAT